VSPSYQERWEGYLLALREHGLEPRKELMLVHTQEEEETITEAIRRLDNQPSAWFCLNDGFAFYVSLALRQLGYQIPDEISICGFDNSHYSQMASPKITTMEVDLSLFAHKAFEQLMWRIKHPDEAYQEILLPTRLIVRESTATVKA